MKYIIEAACGTNVGRVRGNNEDNFCFNGSCFDQRLVSLAEPLVLKCELDGVLLSIFDGMGGGDYGEEASAAAARRMRQLLARREKTAQPIPFLEDASRQANLAVCAKQHELDTRRMGSTMAALYFSGNAVYACNVGDSRIFGLRQGTMLRISRDHTDEQFMKEQGITGRKPRLTQYLGMDPEQVQLEPHIVKGQLLPGDRYLICSDGLTDMLTEQEIQNILCQNENLSAAVHALIEAALEQGGQDNVTVALCRIIAEGPEMEEKDERNTSKDRMAGLGDRAVPWGRQLRDGLRDAARRLRNR